VGLIVLGPSLYLEYIRYLWSVPDHSYSWVENLSPRATFLRTFGSTGGGGTLAKGLALALDAVLLVLFARSIPRAVASNSSVTDSAWGVGLTAILLLSPFTEEHHLVVLLLPLSLLLLAEPPVPVGWKDQALLLTSILLLGSRYSFNQFPAFHHGPLSLLASGKILGVAALAWALIRRLRAARGTMR
jgi:hypothetical protein